MYFLTRLFFLSGLYVNCPVCAKPMYKKNIARHIAVKHTDQTPSQEKKQ